MSPPIRSQVEERDAGDGALDPALLRIIEALAEAQARRDYALRFAPEDSRS